ncbi:RtcB family protein [Halosegnis longus]|uniref:RtcB family protein n=1 Tax=Halosegnis longus TaxID=2216012 RepID=UPI001562DD58|nr:RtcB family protein [Halosegnis longus]
MTDTETHVDGDVTSAIVKGLDESEIEDMTLDFIEAYASHPAFTNEIRVMPDTHPEPNSESVIGFTMELDDGVVPNVVGVDIGCGMLAYRLVPHDYDREYLLPEDMHDDIVDAVRKHVPMAHYDYTDKVAPNMVPSEPGFNFVDEMPWDECTQKLEAFREQVGLELDPDWFDGYDADYFSELSGRVGANVNTAISQLGTLGGGNHFIELAEDEDGGIWVVIHSGSRHLGKQIGEHWQNRATELRRADWIADNLDDELKPYIVPDVDDVSREELLEWFHGGQGRSYIDSDAIREDFDGVEIEEMHDRIREAHPSRMDGNRTHDALYGEEAAGYYIDMIFAQQYASTSRKLIAKQVRAALASVCGMTRLVDEIESVHNFIDFEDGVMRKGACSARDGEQLVIPFNMAEGSIIARGVGNDEWNQSAPHGAGRVMSRGEARNEIDPDDVAAQLSGITSSDLTDSVLEEAPDAYKEAATIQRYIDETATVERTLTPLINIKALE